jgi:hypothetical protein
MWQPSRIRFSTLYHTNFHTANEKTHSIGTQKSSIFSSGFGAMGGGCAQWVPIEFPSCSIKFPSSFNVFPKMFPMASHLLSHTYTIKGGPNGNKHPCASNLGSAQCFKKHLGWANYSSKFRYFLWKKLRNFWIFFVFFLVEVELVFLFFG